MRFRINLKSKYLEMAEILYSMQDHVKKNMLRGIRCSSYRTYQKQRQEFS